MDSFYEFLQDEVDKFGYSLYAADIRGAGAVHVEYGYDEEDDKPFKELTDADIKGFWQDYLDNHIATTQNGIYEGAAEFAIQDYKRKIALCKKSIKQHQTMMELYVNDESTTA